MDARKQLQLRQSQRVSVKEIVMKQNSILSLNNLPIFNFDTLSMTQGKVKTRKTFNASAIAASVLSDAPVLGYSSNLPPEKKKVLYIDTEQSRGECAELKTRILKMAGLPVEDMDEKLVVVSLLNVTDPAQILEVVDGHISDVPDVGLVIIDGIRDLVRDINDSSEVYNLVRTIQDFAVQYHTHIHCILHENKGSDTNARGHLGTELTNKSQTVLRVETPKDKPDSSNVLMLTGRGKLAGGFNFSLDSYDDIAIPVLNRIL